MKYHKKFDEFEIKNIKKAQNFSADIENPGQLSDEDFDTLQIVEQNQVEARGN